VKLLFKISLLLQLLLVNHTQAAEPSKWQKYDISGNPVAIKMGPWQCAKDNHTGLTWEVKSWHEDAHYYKASYSYYDPISKQGVKDGGSCQQGEEWYACDISDYIKTINEQAYCGITSWRLPTLDELKTLVYRKNIAGKLLINPYIFPRTTRAVYMTADKTMVDGQLTIDMMDFWHARVQRRRVDVVANVRLVSEIGE
jgi:hypothetical protein